jgi:hypothetical protein
MDATAPFIVFVSQFLVPTKRQRYQVLVQSEKGRKKLLDDLCHEFLGAIRPECIQRPIYDRLLDAPCLVFHGSIGFGALRSSMRVALAELGSVDSWLIVLGDGSAGAHRPEGRWDAEILIAE